MQNYLEAINAGYSDQEIAEYLTKQNGVDINAGLNEGYSHGEIARHLSGVDEDEWQKELKNQQERSWNAAHMGDVERGLHQGVDTAQAGGFGAVGLVGSLLKKAGAENVGKKIKDWGVEGYKRNMEQASLYPTKSFSDVEGIGDFADYIQGLAASQVPIIGETILGTALTGGVGYGVAKAGVTQSAKALAKKTIANQIKNGALKESAKEVAETALEKSLVKGFMKGQGRKTIQRAAKAGMVGTVTQLESGLNYGELLEEHGIDAPGSSLAFGTLSGLIETLGGNVGLVDDFIGAVAKKLPGSYIKRAAKRLATNVPAEALQEAGQEVNSILNVVLNTDEKALTPENMARIFESAVGGAMFGAGGGAIQAIGRGELTDTGEADRVSDLQNKRLDPKQALSNDPIKSAAADQENDAFLDDVIDSADTQQEKFEYRKWEEEIKRQQAEKAEREARKNQSPTQFEKNQKIIEQVDQWGNRVVDVPEIDQTEYSKQQDEEAYWANQEQQIKDQGSNQNEINQAKINAALSDEEAVDREMNQTIAGQSDFNQKIDAMQSEVNNSETGGVNQEPVGQDGETIRYAATSPNWMKQIQQARKADGKDALSRKEINTLFDKVRNNKPLTERQQDQFAYLEKAINGYTGEQGELVAQDEANDLESKGYDLLGGQKVSVANLNEGDKVVATVDGVKDEFEVKDTNDQGETLLQDGVAKRVDMFDEISVEAIKKSGLEKSQDSGIIEENQKHLQGDLFNENPKQTQQLELFPVSDTGKGKGTKNLKAEKADPGDRQLSQKISVGVETTGSIEHNGLVVKSHADAASLLTTLLKSPQEKLYTVTTDKNGTVIEIHAYSKGNVTSSVASPSELAGRIFRLKKAKKTFFVHNHPSGHTAPSVSDIKTFKSLKNILKLRKIDVDGIIIGNDGEMDSWTEFGEYSDHENGYFPKYRIPKAGRGQRIPVKERVFKKKEKLGPYVFVNKKNKPQEKIFKEVEGYLKDKPSGFLLLNPRAQEVGFLRFPSGERARDISAKIFKAIEKTNASSMIIHNKQGDNFEREDFLNSVANGIRSTNFPVIDIVSLVDGQYRHHGPGANSSGFMGMDSDDIKYQIVHHGSPNKWQPEPGFPNGRPRLDKIGEGEGVQMYGWGWYSAENADVAKTYAPRDYNHEDKLMELYERAEAREDYAAMEIFESAMLHETTSEIEDKLEDGGYDDEFLESAYVALDQLQNMEESGTSLYKLDIPDKYMNQIINWDSLISEMDGQNLLDEAEAQNWSESEIEDLRDAFGFSDGYRGQPETVGGVYGLITDILGSDKSASEFFDDAGYVGQKYADQETRSAGEEGTYNYVIWNQDVLDDIALLERNGKKLKAINALYQATQSKQYYKPSIVDTDDGIHFETGVPVTFPFVHNKESATAIFGLPNKNREMDVSTGRTVEASGRYVVHSYGNGQYVKENPDKFDTGYIAFKNPLVIDSEGLGYKKKLSDSFGGLTGKNLSKAIIAAGYDGVVTTDSEHGEASEIIDLTTFDETKALYQSKKKSDKLSKKEKANVRNLDKRRDAFQRKKKYRPGSVKEKFHNIFGYRDQDGTTDLTHNLTRERQQLREIGKAFGKEIHFFKSEDPKLKRINGLTNPAGGNEIFINADSTDPLISIAGHELIHQLKHDHADLYDFILNSIRVSDDNFQKYIDIQTEGRGGTFADIKEQEGWYEEFIGDFASDQFQRVEFWQKLLNKDKTLTQRIIDTLNDILLKIKNLFPRAEQFVSNFKESQDALSYAMSEALRRNNISKSESKKGNTRFSVANEKSYQKNESSPTDQDYTENRKQHKDIRLKASMTFNRLKREAAKGVDKYLGSISTRLKKISPKISAKIRKLDFDTNTKISEDLQIAVPLLNKAKKMPTNDRADWDYARKNSDKKKLDELHEKYDMKEEYQAVRDMLDRIRQEAIDAGYEIGEIEEYWPRVLKDQEGFLNAIDRGPERPEFTDALKQKAKGMGIEVWEMDETLRADILSNMILGKYYGIPGPGSTKQRVFKKIPAEFNKFYMDSDGALIHHINSMRKRIEARRFFGKVPEKISKAKQRLRSAETRLRKIEDSGDQDKITDVQDRITKYRAIIEKYKHQNDFSENIGSYVLELLATKAIKPTDENTLKEILTARFNEHGTRGLVNIYKNLSYIDTMGSPISALTQIGDLAWSAYEGGLIRTLKNAFISLKGKSRITREDVGVERIAQEFADADTLGKAVSHVFKLVGLEKIDAIGKESLLNTAFQNYKKQAKKNPNGLKSKIKHIFQDETDSVIEDLLNDNVTDNVKLLVYHRLLDFQPVALSEMPEKYLTAGNGRIFYMLKTFTLKQFDVYRKEIYQGLRHGNKQQKIQAMKNMVYLTSLFVLANAGADELKDWVLGRDTDLEDRVVDNILRLFGISKFVTWKARTEGVGSALAKQILPPFKFIDAATRDLVTTGDDKGSRTLASVPLVGKLAYWHLGRGRHSKGNRWDRKFSKEKRRLKEIDDQLEQSKNKFKFQQEHREDLKKYKTVKKLQGRLNKNRKHINALKKKPQTQYVKRKIEKLEKERVNVLRFYFGRK